MFATNTTWSVNNKPGTHTTNLNLLMYKTCATKKSKHMHVHKTHINIQTQWKKQNIFLKNTNKNHVFATCPMQLKKCSIKLRKC
jgi:hypothetical protein